jgi:hypothetical protein
VNRCTISSELLAQYLIARSAREDRAWKPLPSSLTHRRKRVCPFVRPGQRRAILGALGSADFVVARIGSRAAVLRRSESTRMSSASDDKVGGLPARSAASGSEQSNRGRAPALPPCPVLASLAEAGAG